MRSLASSIIILASCVVFSAAAFVQHSDTNLFLNGVAVIVGVVGIHGWFTSARDSSSK